MLHLKIARREARTELARAGAIDRSLREGNETGFWPPLRNLDSSDRKDAIVAFWLRCEILTAAQMTMGMFFGLRCAIVTANKPRTETQSQTKHRTSQTANRTQIVHMQLGQITSVASHSNQQS